MYEARLKIGHRFCFVVSFSLCVWACVNAALSLGAWSFGSGRGGFLGHGWNLGGFCHPPSGTALPPCCAAFGSVWTGGLRFQMVKIRSIAASPAAGSASSTASGTACRAAGCFLRIWKANQLSVCVNARKNSRNLQTELVLGQSEPGTRLGPHFQGQHQDKKSLGHRCHLPYTPMVTPRGFPLLEVCAVPAL